jgi:release factor glutamine methyltransferase
MTEKAWTLLELLNTTKQFLVEKNVENPRGNVEAFFVKALSLSRIELYLQHDRPITELELQEIRNLVRRRLKHEPLQLIVGQVEFCDATVELQPGVLIPRPETEEMVVHTFSVVRQLKQNQPVHVLDIGCGSGCISIGLAFQNPTWVVDAIDLDPVAVQCTNHNAVINNLQSRVSVTQADVFDPQFTSRIQPPYDLVISNPPYVTESEYLTLAPELKDYEPKHALVAADNGLAVYKRIAALMPALLKQDGVFACEFGFAQAEAIKNIFSAHFKHLDLHKDLAGLNRFAIGTNCEPYAINDYPIVHIDSHE